LPIDIIFAEESLGHRCSSGSSPSVDPTQDLTESEDLCVKASNTDYKDIFITTGAELPGILITAAIIDRLGRKKTQALDFVVAGFFCFILFACSGRTMETIFLFCIRASITGAWQVCYVYTPEVYPTSVRSTAMGVCSSLARIGAMLTPYVAQVVVRSSVYLALSFYGIVSLFAAVASMMLPIETTGRQMPSTIKDTLDSKPRSFESSIVDESQQSLVDNKVIELEQDK